jgi:thymidine kinase
MSTKSGYLELIIGPMFSGKTTRIIELYHKYKNQGKKVLVINYHADRRYHDSMLSTHDRKMIPCLFTDQLSELISVPNMEYETADIILINEGQFFSDLYAAVLFMVENSKKTVHTCGLDGDFRREKFGEILDLLPICDSIVKLTSKCNRGCLSPALFSHRICEKTERVLIGSDIYIPLCRSCYRDVNGINSGQVSENTISK